MNFSRHDLQILFVAGILLLSGRGAEPIAEANFEHAHFAPFVEPDFPFITTSVDARRLGPGFPEDNIVARGLALRLGEQAYACFDTDMLRWSVAWTGAFLPMVTMAQISYQDFHKKDNQIPLIAGEPKLATGLYAGWGGAEPEFTDPQPIPIFPNGARCLSKSDSQLHRRQRRKEHLGQRAKEVVSEDIGNIGCVV